MHDSAGETPPTRACAAQPHASIERARAPGSERFAPQPHTHTHGTHFQH